METVKIVFDVDSKDIKSTTDELKALNKVTNDEVAAMERLSNSASDAGDGFVSLRTRVKEAKEEAVRAAEKYGEFSTQALNAKKKAGELADQMGDLNRQVNLLNPEAKAKAFSNLAQGVVGAFSIATGALQAFGVKNKEVEELAMKLQAALNITQGIASLTALKESYQDIKVVLGFTVSAQEAMVVANEAEAVSATEAAVATKGFTASLLTNPIFLTVAAIGALAAAYMTLNDQTKSAILNEKELADAKKKTTELKNKEKQTDIDLLVAKNQITKQEGERRKIELKRQEDTAELQKKLADLDKEEKKNNETIKEKTRLGEEYSKSSRESAAISSASAFKAASDARDANKQIAQSRKVLQDQLSTIDKTASNEKKQQDIEEINDNKAKNEKLAQQAEQKRNQALAKQKQQDDSAKAAREKAYNDELTLRKLQQQGEIDKLKTEDEKLAKQKEFNESNYKFSKAYYEEVGRSATEISILEQDFLNQQGTLTQKQNDIQEKTLKDRLKGYEDFINKMNDLSSKGEMDPIKKLQAETDAAEEEYVKQYALAVKNGEDTTKLTESFFNYQESQRKKMEEEDKKNGDKQIAERKKTAEQEAEDKIAAAKFAIDAISQLSQSITALQKSQADAEIADVQALYDKKLISEKAYNAKLKEIKRKQWEADKRNQIVTATMSIAQGIINALSVQPANLVPFAVGLASTVGALQLATIIATKPPQFAKGTLSVPGIDMGKDSVHAILQPGEAVIPTKTNRAYHPTIKAIYEKKISPSEINNFVMSRTKSGGSSAITANVDTYALSRALGKNKTVEVGNANMIGKAMARELLRGQNYRRA